MKSNVLLFAPLCFLLCWMLLVDSMGIRFSFTSHDDPIKLDMAENSVDDSFTSRLHFWPHSLSMVKDAVDDMYFGCNRTMTEMVKSKYFKKEKTFWDVWENASECANDNLNNRDPEDEALTKDHMQAICVYTSNYKDFYQTFNSAVRNSRSVYNTSFPYHFLHFWLTSAVQILNKENCETTYRRTDLKFSGSVNQIIRFGVFASSSKKTNLTLFGHKTCFSITTCSGAYLTHYSAFKGEEEVLIPPYEMFKITAKKKGGDVKGLSDCGVVYMLVSAGVLSNLNCMAVN